MAICEVCGVCVADADTHVAWHEQRDRDDNWVVAQLRLKADRESHPSVAGLRRLRLRNGP